MKKYILPLLFLTSCNKDLPTVRAVSTPVQTTAPVVVQPTTPVATTSAITIKNTHPTKTITGVYIDGVLQKLDVGSYPVGANQTVTAKKHDVICPYVYFPLGCRTKIDIRYGGTSTTDNTFNDVKVYRVKSRYEDLIISGPVSEDGMQFIWNYRGGTSTLGIDSWLNGGYQISRDIWYEPIKIIAN